MRKSNFLWSFMIVIMIVSITSVVVIAKTMNTPDESETLKSKVRDEMNYLDEKISSMINSLNNLTLTNYIVEDRKVTSQEEKTANNTNDGSENTNSLTEQNSTADNSSSSSQGSSQSKQPQNLTEMKNNTILSSDRNVDWSKLDSSVEVLHSSWSTILLDLYKLNINKDDILKFSSLLDQLTLNIKDKKKIEALDSLTQMYSCIVGYIHSFAGEDELYKNVAKTKESVFYAYANVDKDNWDEVKNHLQNAENAYIPVVNNINHKEKEFTINKAYITLKELQNGIADRDKDVFYIKYKNVLEELNILMG